MLPKRHRHWYRRYRDQIRRIHSLATPLLDKLEIPIVYSDSLGDDFSYCSAQEDNAVSSIALLGNDCHQPFDFTRVTRHQ